MDATKLSFWVSYNGQYVQLQNNPIKLKSVKLSVMCTQITGTRAGFYDLYSNNVKEISIMEKS